MSWHKYTNRKLLYERLLSNRRQIERRFGGRLEFVERSTSGVVRNNIHGQLYNDSAWDETIPRLVESMLRLQASMASELADFHETTNRKTVGAKRVDREKNDAIDDINDRESEFSRLSKKEVSTLQKARIGQGLFRERLIKRWKSCSVTGLQATDLLTASHIKPWCKSKIDECTHPDNGLLLSPALDRLFDQGYITFEDDGRIRLSSLISDVEYCVLNVHKDMRLRKVPENSKRFLLYHREEVYLGNDS